MHFLKVLYYHYFLFYTRVLPDDEPHATVVFTLSFSESLLINTLIDWIGAVYFCRHFMNSTWAMVSIFIVLLCINYFVFIRDRKGIKIVKQQPMLWGSRKLSRAFAITFWLITTSFLFWTVQYFRYVIGNCK